MGLELPPKGQTRRPVKEGEWFVDQLVHDEPDRVVQVIGYGKWRVKYEVGRTYAVQPGRGKKAVGRIEITKIRRERLQKIEPHEFKLEGMPTAAPAEVLWFIGLWDGMHRKPYRWEDNPEVWVLDFKCIEGAESTKAQ